MSRFARHAQLASVVVATLLVYAGLNGPGRRANAQITGLAVDNSNSSGSVSTGTGQAL